MEEQKQKGFIKIYRSLLEWEWYTEPNTVHLFIFLILKANYKPKKWKGILLDRGDLVTSMDHISKGTGLSISKIRTSLDRLIKTGCVRKHTTNKYTVLRVINYKDYQEVNDNVNKQIYIKDNSGDEQLNTTKERIEKENNKKNKERKDFTNSQFLLFYFKDEVENLFKKHWLPEHERKYCLAKFDEKKIVHLSLIHLEGYLKNWCRNLEKDGSMDGYRQIRALKRLD